MTTNDDDDDNDNNDNYEMLNNIKRYRHKYSTLNERES